jgi:hypothetical protein
MKEAGREICEKLDSMAAVMVLVKAQGQRIEKSELPTK